jgi:nicotinamidase-related amidase
MYPKYFDENNADKIYALNMPEIIKEATDYKKQNNVKSAALDKEKIGLFIIDAQNSFTNPNGSLFVPGSVEDNIRTAKFIYNNVDKLTSIYMSLDTHFTYQIFNPTWWKDSNGNYPDPFTIITYDDIKADKWRAQKDPVGSGNYVKELEQNGKKNLCIWPLHCLLGSSGHAVNSILHEAVKFQEVVKTSMVHYETKGTIPTTEYYSVLEPEVKQQMAGGTFNTRFYQTLMTVDKLYICGQASGFCVLETVESIKRQIGNDKSLLSKIYILRDCMSSVPAIQDDNGNIIVDCPKIANDAIDGWANIGINVVKSTDSI